MKATYINRYGDTITFKEQSNNIVAMSGYDPAYVRVGWENDYSEAYEIYSMECLALSEPDMNLLVEDVNDDNRGILRKFTYPEFAYHVDEAMHDKKKFYNRYCKYVYTDFERYKMFDPSGGPYISIGMNVGLYFDDKKPRIVQEINVLKTKTYLTVSHE